MGLSFNIYLFIYFFLCSPYETERWSQQIWRILAHIQKLRVGNCLWFQVRVKIRLKFTEKEQTELPINSLHLHFCCTLSKLNARLILCGVDNVSLHHLPARLQMCTAVSVQRWASPRSLQRWTDHKRRSWHRCPGTPSVPTPLIRCWIVKMMISTTNVPMKIVFMWHVKVYPIRHMDI